MSDLEDKIKLLEIENTELKAALEYYSCPKNYKAIQCRYNGECEYKVNKQECCSERDVIEKVMGHPDFECIVFDTLDGLEVMDIDGILALTTDRRIDDEISNR